MTITLQSDVVLTTPGYSSPDYCWHELVLINRFDLVKKTPQKNNGIIHVYIYQPLLGLVVFASQAAGGHHVQHLA